MNAKLVARRSAAAVAISIVGFTSGLSHAGPTGVETTATVNYADLNVSTQAGVDQLYYRLRRASLDVCNVRTLRDSGSLRLARASKACYDAALAAAMDGVGFEVLAAKARKTGRRKSSTT